MKSNIFAKLILTPLLALILTGLLIGFVISQMNVLANLTTMIYDHPLQVTRAVLNANVGVIKMHRSMKDVALSTNETEMIIAIEMVNRYEQEVYEQIAIIDEWILGQEGKDMLAVTVRLLEDWKPTRDQVIHLTEAGKREEAFAITRGIGAFQVGLINDHMEGLKDYAAGRASGMLVDMESTRARIMSSTVIAMLATILTIGIAGFTLTRSITVPLRELIKGVEEIGQGNLDYRVDVRSKDEIGQFADAFNRMAAARETAEQDLRLQSEILANMNEGVLLIKANNGVIVYANHRFEDMFGYDHGELLGKHISIINAPTEKNPEETSKEFKEILAKNGSWQGEVSNIKKDGTLLWCSESVTLFDHPSYGDVLVSVHTDISERVLVENALLEYRGQLEERVKERTSELSAADERLQQEITERKQVEEIALDSEKMASIGRLAAGMAHEINSPLQLVTGLSERLTRQINENDIDSEQFLTDLNKVNKSGWRIANIIRSLLTYAHQAANDIASHQLNEIVEETLFLIEHQLKSWANTTIRKELALDLPPIQCDSNKITQVIINLLENARDAMAPDGGEITIRTGYDQPEKRFILQFHNTGSPIPDEIQAKIFEPFFTTKGIGKGTGLGLSIVHGIVTAHGGEIAVESTPEKGTTFTIQLPEEPARVDPQDNTPIEGHSRYDP